MAVGNIGVMVRPVNRADGRVDANDVRGNDNALGRALNALVAAQGTVAVASTATDTTLTATNHLVLVDASAAARTITLPPAADVPEREYRVKKMDATANTVTLDGDGGETIDGAATYVLTTQYEVVEVVSTGTAWVVT